MASERPVSDSTAEGCWRPYSEHGLYSGGPVKSQAGRLAGRYRI